MTTDSNTPQNYILYRTRALGWQAVGYVIVAMQLTAEQATGAPAGFAYTLDTAGAYPDGSLYRVPSTAYALSGAATATAGTALTLDLTPDNYGPKTETLVTLSDGGAGGTFSSGTVTFGAGIKTPQAVTYTPKAAGTVIISATNNGGLTDPASLSVTVAAAS
ncbi:hypothetical protein D3W54_15220 [Komagataeibacter medellinensis]|uniref:Uncharacterized protein n=1 Tax=Komagataeibacter medellinensis TaxID=1177712 RepID=A0ABQ6VRF4_9PROT|nr:hypothetical protein [Komagataeibacter medellinensis]KAB8122526.1 hypothetical protein D3W54_15220 [Komagataeibacter medellinensis]